MKSESEENLLENARILQKIWLHRVFPIVFFSIMGKAKKLKVSKQNTVTTGEHQIHAISASHAKENRPINRWIKHHSLQWVHLETRLQEVRWQLQLGGTKIARGWTKMKWAIQSLWPPLHTNSEKLLWPCPHIGVSKIWWKVVLQFWELAPTPVGASQETKPHSSLNWKSMFEVFAQKETAWCWPFF